MAQQTYKLWKAALPSANPTTWSGMPMFLGRMEGETFHEAVENYVKELPASSQPLYTLRDGKWYFREVHQIHESYDEARNTPPLGASIPKRISVWKEGFDANGYNDVAQRLFDATGKDLNDVVKTFVDGILDGSKNSWKFDAERGIWYHWGCRVFDSEADARKAYG